MSKSKPKTFSIDRTKDDFHTNEEAASFLSALQRRLVYGQKQFTIEQTALPEGGSVVTIKTNGLALGEEPTKTPALNDGKQGAGPTS